MHNVPTFPSFRRVTLADQEWYNQFFKDFDPIADFSFGNLIIWLDQHDDLEISQLHGNIILKCTTLFMQDKLMLTFIGKKYAKETARELLTYQAKHGLTQELVGVPSCVAQQLSSDEKFNVTDDRDNYEYVLDVDLLASMQGSGMRNFRYEARAFMRKYGSDTLIKELELEDPKVRELLHKAVFSWPKAFSTNESADQESVVIERTLKYGAELGYQNLSVFVNDELAGFMLYQNPPQKHAVIANHMKSSYKYPWTFNFMVHALANRLRARSIRLLNFEQDLGLPGLRLHKLDLQPIDFYKKYSITPRRAE